MEESMNLYQRMRRIASELPAVSKNLKVGDGRYQYKAVGEADVLAAVKPLEDKYGVYSYPSARKIIDREIRESDSNYGKKYQTWLRVETTYRFVNVDKPEEYLEITSYGDGIDSADKAPGKAMTYSDKYALLKAYKIQTGDDPDQTWSGDIDMGRPRKKMPDISNLEFPPKAVCEECGKEVTGYTDSSGKEHTAEEVLNHAKKKFDKVLCLDCYRKLSTAATKQ